jgi:hypothetical protein
VPRDEDIGVDFYCSVASQIGNQLTFDAPYLVQIKGSTPQPVRYGGIDGKSGDWREWHIDWLFGQELPFLLGFIDKSEMRMDLYLTGNMWCALYLAGRPTEVVLEPGERNPSYYDLPFPTSERIAKWQCKGDDARWHVPLGAPMISMTADDAENASKLDGIRWTLRRVIGDEQRNIGYRRLQVHYARLPFVVERTTTGPAIGYKDRFAGNRIQGANTEEQLYAALPIICTLALNYRQQGRLSEMEMLKPIVRATPECEVKRTLRGNFPELFED